MARIVADDPNLSPDQWFAFTPPRVPVLQTLQQLIGSQTPVLMDIATAANFPCQRPFSEHLGVAELPQYRILPDLKQTAVSSNLWEASSRPAGRSCSPRRCCGPRRSRPTCAATGTATGAPSSSTTAWCRPIRRPKAVSRAGRRSRCTAGAGKDRSGHCRERDHETHPAADRPVAAHDVRLTRWVAMIAGLIGFVLSVATPLLPVVQTTATLNWPQHGQLNNVTAPLISQTPVTMTATVPCSVVRDDAARAAA